ncbi:MAG: D-alanine--D-alanine ligase [Oscillospiraceae bacterium]|nr:D-alanine--D-alanine ligase [Oscillospiraceae bacterium]
MRIVVLAGGLSPERDVSLSSGSLVANALLDKGHSVVMADVYEGIEFPECREDLFILPSGSFRYHYDIPGTAPNLDKLIEKHGGRMTLIGKNILELCEMADVVFIALHGAMGENGQLQAVLECHDIRYTGSDYCGSLLAMDKDLSKKLMRLAGVPTADWVPVRPTEESLREVREVVGFPCVIKPTHCGSSVGVSIISAEEDFLSAVCLANDYESTVLAEKMIPGREFSVGILGGEVLPAIEIIPHQGFYDYTNKYQKGLATEVCPADLSPEQAESMARYAQITHDALRLGSYSRVDFILGADGVFYCLEANTLPGMTPTSLLPQEAAQVGLSYSDLCDRIVRMALK